MMRSLYSAVSGLRNHQTRMDVIGNNIANVNTVGFKASRTIFQDVYSQTARSASAANEPQYGGTNPSQIGLGVKLAAIDVLHNPAATQRTDNPLDLAIEGDGFFTVRQGTQTLYTRAGNLYVDEAGNLVTAGGEFILGIMGAESNEPVPLDPVELGVEATVTLNGEPESGRLFRYQPQPTADPTLFHYAILIDGRYYDLDDVTGVDPTDFNATTTIAAADEIHPTSVTLEALIQEYDVYEDLNGKQYLGVNGDTANPNHLGVPAGEIWYYDLQGNPVAGNPAVVDPIDVGTLELAMKKMNWQAPVKHASGAIDGKDIGAINVDGFLNIYFDKDGTINGLTPDGEKVVIGYLAIATFTNNMGLEKVGDSFYAKTANSGEPVYSTAMSGAAGKINPGGLEMSNVDLSAEFTDMIVTQRGFQANSRVITVSDSMLEELVNLKR